MPDQTLAQRVAALEAEVAAFKYWFGQLRAASNNAGSDGAAVTAVRAVMADSGSAATCD